MARKRMMVINNNFDRNKRSKMEDLSVKNGREGVKNCVVVQKGIPMSYEKRCGR